MIQSQFAAPMPSYVKSMIVTKVSHGFTLTGIFDGDNLGYGIKESLTGEKKYEGHFNSKGNLEGYGTLTYKNGCTMVGMFINGECVSGTYTFPSGGKDIGTRKKNRLDGPDCIRIRPNGHTQIGLFENDEFVSGVEESGPRENGVLHGESCARVSAEGVKKTGRFENGQLREGVETHPNGNVWQGHWNSQGQFHGEGNVTWGGDFHAIDEWGTYENGRLVNGTVRLKNGQVDIGPRLNGALHGVNCIRIFADTTTFFGEFKDDEFVSGTGIQIATDGNRYAGVMKGCKLEGMTQ